MNTHTLSHRTICRNTKYKIIKTRQTHSLFQTVHFIYFHLRTWIYYINYQNYQTLIFTEDNQIVEHMQYRNPFYTVEPRYNKGPRDWQCIFAISMFFLNWASLPFILLLLGAKNIVRLPRSSWYRSSLYRGSTCILKSTFKSSTDCSSDIFSW